MSFWVGLAFILSINLEDFHAQVYTVCPKTHVALIWIQSMDMIIFVHEEIVILATEGFLQL